MTQPIRVVTVDDHHLIRGGIQQALANAPDITVVAEGECGDHVLQLLEQHTPDILILDIGMPQTLGQFAQFTLYPTLKTICRDYPETRVLIISQYVIDLSIRSTIAAGVSGYLDKSDVLSFRDLAKIIRNIHSGGYHFSKSTIRAVADNPDLAKHGPFSLTPKQYRFLLSLTAQPGKTFQAMGHHLGVSESSIKKYSTAINGSFQAYHIWHALLLAIKFGVIPITLIDNPEALMVKLQSADF